MNNNTNDYLNDKKSIKFQLKNFNNESKNNETSVNEIWTNTFYIYYIQRRLLYHLINFWAAEIIFILCIVVNVLLLDLNISTSPISFIINFAIWLFFIIFLWLLLLVILILYFIRILKIIDRFQFDTDISAFFKGIKVWSSIWFIFFIASFLTGISAILGFIFLTISISKSKSLLMDIQNRYELQDFYPPSFSIIKYVHNDFKYHKTARKWLEKYYSIDDLNKNNVFFSDQKVLIISKQDLQIIRKIKKITFLGSFFIYISGIFVGPWVLYLSKKLKNNNDQKNWFFKMSLLSTMLIIIFPFAYFINSFIYKRAKSIINLNKSDINEKDELTNQ